MKRWLSVTAWTAGAVLVGSCAGLYAVVPWSPFGESAGALAGLLPEDVDAALRLDPSALRRTPIARRLGDSPAVLDVLADLGLELPEGASEGVLPLLGNDVALGAREDEWLLLIRVSGPLHATRIALARRVAWGAVVERDGETTVYDVGHGESLYVRQLRDVFALSPDPDLVADAAACHDGRRSLAPVCGSALREAEAPGSRAFAWLSTDIVRALLDSPELGVLSAAVPSPRSGGAGVVLACTSGEASADLDVSWRAPSAVPTSGAGDVRANVSSLATAASALGPPGEVLVEVGLDVTSEGALELLPEEWALRLENHALGQGAGAADVRPRDQRGTARILYLPLAATAGESVAAAIREALDEETTLHRENVRGVTVYSPAEEANGQVDGGALAVLPDALVHSSSRAHLLDALATFSPPCLVRADGREALFFRADFAALARLREDRIEDVVRVAATDKLSEHGFRIRTMIALHEEGITGDEMKRELARRAVQWREESAQRRRDEALREEEIAVAALRTCRDLVGSAEVVGNAARLQLRLRAR